MATFSEWLEASGFDDPKALNNKQRDKLLATWKQEEAAEGVTPEAQTPEEVAAAGRAEVQRRRRVTEMVASAIQQYPGNLRMIETVEALGRQAIDGGWDEQKAELAFLRATRASAPHLHIPQGAPNVTDDVIEAAVCLAGGLESPDKHFPAQTLDTARKKWRHGLSIGELVITAARARGYHGINLKAGLKEALQAAFSPTDIRAGMTGPSTYSIPNILSNVANKFVNQGFLAVDNAWSMIAARRSVNDFKQITSFSLTGHLQYNKVAPGGELKHGELGERTYNNQADTYGILIGIDRRDLINDDTGALSGASRRLGRGAGLKINDVFWTVFLNNSSFFTSGNSNVLTGTTPGTTNSALGLEGLQNADRVFRLQTDPDGKPLGILPSILLVPSALRITALNLMNSTIVVATNTATTTTLAPNNNAFAGAYTVVSSPYMSNSSYTGNSSTAWYLLASPSEMPVIEGCFLNGVESPTIETADFDFNTLGVAMRGVHDFGFSLQEYRGGVRAAGA